MEGAMSSRFQEACSITPGLGAMEDVPHDLPKTLPSDSSFHQPAQSSANFATVIVPHNGSLRQGPESLLARLQRTRLPEHDMASNIARIQRAHTWKIAVYAMTPKQYATARRKGGMRSYQLMGASIFAMTPEQRSAASRKGGLHASRPASAFHAAKSGAQ